MSRFIGRSLLACSLLLVLSACQSAFNHVDEPTDDEFTIAEQVFSAHLAAQELELAAHRLDDVRMHQTDEPRIALLQQRLADAWLASGEQALQRGDVEAASAALIQAKRLLPQAPALTEGLSTAIAAAQMPVVEAEPMPATVVKRPPTHHKPAPVKPVVNIEVLLEPDTAPVELGTPAAAVELPESKRSKIKARLIDANAESTVIPMPMLNSRNNHQLGRLLDDVAVDVVRFRATVAIEVADTLDFHWVAALLSARVTKLDANFKPRLEEVIRSEEPAQLVITPNKSL